MTRRAPWLEIAVTVAAALLYFATAAHHVLGGDNGEFATLVVRPGVAHPSGYPLYSLVLGAMAWLPATSPAHAGALATALLGTATVWMVMRACLAWGTSSEAAAATGALYATSPLLWTASTHAEVFALHALIAATLVWATGPQLAYRDVRRLIILALCAACGLANNHSIVLTLPIGCLGVLRAVREGARPRHLAIAAGASLCLLGGLYLWPWAIARWAASPWVWGDPGDLEGLFALFRRADYGTTRLAIGDGGAEPGQHIALLATNLLVDLRGAALLAGVPGLVWLARGRATRAGALVLLAAATLAGPIFVALFNLPATDLATQVTRRFHLLPAVLLAVPIAAGFDLVLRRLHAVLAAAVVCTIFALGVFLSLPELHAHNSNSVENYARDTLESLPPNAVLLGTGDMGLYTFLYLKHAVGVRTDVTYLDVRMLVYPWYFERARTELAVPISPPDGINVSSRRLAAEIMAAGRPVFLADRFSDAIAHSFPTYAYGTCVAVLPPGAATPSSAEVAAINRRLVAAFRTHAPQPTHDAWAQHAQERYRRAWELASTPLNTRP